LALVDAVKNVLERPFKLHVESDKLFVCQSNLILRLSWLSCTWLIFEEIFSELKPIATDDRLDVLFKPHFLALQLVDDHVLAEVHATRGSILTWKPR